MLIKVYLYATEQNKAKYKVQTFLVHIQISWPTPDPVFMIRINGLDSQDLWIKSSENIHPAVNESRYRDPKTNIRSTLENAVEDVEKGLLESKESRIPQEFAQRIT